MLDYTLYRLEMIGRKVRRFFSSKPPYKYDCNGTFAELVIATMKKHRPEMEASMREQNALLKMLMWKKFPRDPGLDAYLKLAKTK